MNGIKLGPDMVEGCVLINGVRKVIQEIKIAASIVWPLSQEESYSLENAVLHYRNSQGQEYGAYLYPNQSNYAVITADLIKTVGGTVVSTQTVECYPEYSISPTYNEAVITSGNHIIWDKANYGTEQKSADYISVKGFYLDPSGQQHRTDSFRVDIGANGRNAPTSYTYRKSFTISVSGNISASGGQYNFTAESYRTGSGTWTSGSPYTGDEEMFASNLSCSRTLGSISHSVITGTIHGTVTFLPNSSTTQTLSYQFSLTNGSTYTKSYTQDKSVQQYFYIDPTTWSAPQVGGHIDITVYSTYASFSVSSDKTWLSWDLTTDPNVIRVSADANYLSSQQTGTVTFTAQGGPSVTLSVTQAAFVPQLSISPASQSNIPAVGNNYNVLVTHNLPYFTLEASDSSMLSWSGSTSASPATITVRVSSNSGPARTGYLYFKWDNTTLATYIASQLGRQSFLVLHPSESPQYLSGANSLIFTVEASDTWTCEVTMSASGWTVTPDYDNNTVTVSRTASALVRGITFKVTSGANTATMSVIGGTL